MEPGTWNPEPATGPLKIAHVLGAMNFGGVERNALLLIRGLLAPSFSHLVVDTSETEGPQAKEFLNLPDVEVKTCRYHKRRRLGFVLSCAQTLREARPDRVLAYSLGHHAMVSLAARFARVPLTYVRVGGSVLRDRSTQWKSMLFAHLARPFCGGEIAVSESVRRELVEGLWLPDSRVHTILNGCDIQEIERRAAAARRERVGTSPTRILMVSRMDEAKDQPTLLKAIDELRRERSRLEMVFLGDGPQRKKHEELTRRLGISPIVKFLGNRKDVPEWMGRSDVLVHCTHTEGLCNVLIEAMAARVPIVATDIPPCREILDNGRCGLLAPVRNAGGVAATIRRVMDDADSCQSITQAAMERVCSLYDQRVTVERYRRLLQHAEAVSL